MTRFLSIQGKQLPSDTVLVKATGESALSSPDLFTLTCWSKDNSIKLAQVIGTPVSFSITKDKTVVNYHALISAITRGALHSNGWCEYTITLCSNFAFVSDAIISEAFQGKTIIEITEELLGRYSIQLNKKALTKSYPKLAFSLCYQESVFAYVSRLLANAGIYYTWQYSKDNHTLVLHDSGLAETQFNAPVVYNANSAATCRLWHWQTQRNSIPASFYAQAFNPNQANTMSQATVGNNQPVWYQHGKQPIDELALQRELALQAQHQRWQQNSINAQGDYLGLAPGMQLDLTEHHDSSQIGSYTISKFSFKASDLSQLPNRDEAQQQPPSYDCTFSCHTATQAFTPAPMTKPSCPLQLAQVVAENAETKMQVDANGRVPIRFMWEHQSKTQTPIYWIRVSQAWSGPGYGAQFLPGVGDEVLVDFNGGDPDQPIIVGCLNNADRLPAFDAKTHPAKLGFKGLSGNAWEVDDKPGKEAMSLTATQDQHISARGDHTVTIGGNHTTTVQTGNYSEAVNNTLTITAQNDITFSCGDSVLKITSSGVTVQGKEIVVKGGSTPIGGLPEVIPLKTTKTSYRIAVNQQNRNKNKRATGAGEGYENNKAKLAYNKIRKANYNDIGTVAKNSGLSISETKALKKHLFMTKHKYYNFTHDEDPKNFDSWQVNYFSADPEIAFAWEKAQNEELTKEGKTWMKHLANHEIGESKLMAKGIPYRHPDSYDESWGGFFPPPKGAHDMAPSQPTEQFPGYRPEDWE